MASKLAYERYYWFHGQVKGKSYPNATILAKRFELSSKQAQRDIEFMRDRLNAPFIYSHNRRGYEYLNTDYELPPVWLKEDELLAFCLALRLATTLPDKELKDSLRHLLEKCLTFRSLDPMHGLKEMQEKVSVKNIQYYNVNEAIFHTVISALFRSTPVNISYHTPHKDETTERVILPLHLLCYMGSWHLIAFCTLRGELRDFALSRVKTIEPFAQKVKLPDSLPSIKGYIRKNFGLMSGNKSIEVCLKFTPEVSHWISEQIWHKGQEVSHRNDGSLCLKFPVADFREVRREILKYGASVKVISPKDLRKEIKKEIQKMAKVYG